MRIRKELTFLSIPLNLILKREQKEKSTIKRNKFFCVLGIITLIDSFHKCLLNACHAPTSILGLGQRVNKSEKNSDVEEQESGEGRP